VGPGQEEQPHPPPPGSAWRAPPLLVAYGEDETDEFKRQSEEFLGAWRENGLSGERLVLGGKNHFDVVDGFLDAGSPLLSGILVRMGLE
jgi:arylformamidase